MIALACGLVMLGLIGFTVWCGAEPPAEALDAPRKPATDQT